MFRVLFTAYVTAVMLAGPSVCCCTTSRAVAGCFAEDAEARSAPEPCCWGRHTPQDGASRETPAGDESGCPSAPDEKHECPCRANKTHAVAEARKQVADLQQLRLIVPALLDLPAVGVMLAEPPAVCDVAQLPNRASHFGSAREILTSLRTYLI